ncbi:hypothetical protein HMPREF9127_1415 [Parvimonas sp. oral taxon 393 str. F0440]|nr:hypothetical protein HMPREF9127_1415 [Parvimonas sp. oral taxon 393 str. F0440]
MVTLLYLFRRIIKMKNTLKNFSKKAVSMPMVLLLIIIVGG